MSNRGLHNFLIEIYSGATKQDIDTRISVELAKIKKAFFSPKISPYNRKKYILKLCFIVLSGVKVSFGLPQIIDLIESKKVSMQRIGWMAAVIIYGNNSNQINELMPSFKKHLADSKNENGINFTLSAISSIGGSELAENFGPTIAEIALSTNYSDFTRKKALLALVSFYRCSQLQLIDTIAGRLTPLLSDSSYGLRLSVCHLIHTIQIFQPSLVFDVFTQILEILNSFFIKNDFDHEYSTSDIPCSILSAQMIRILSFNTDWNDSEVKLLENILSNILNRFNLHKNKDTQISYFTVFAEIVFLALTVPISENYLDKICQILIDNISSPIFPIRYFCLDYLATFIRFFPQLGSIHNFSLQPLYEMMLYQDSELNVRCIQLLYIIANKENGLDILTEFLNFIPKAPLNIRNLLFQKSSLLALSFSIDEKWCIDTLINLICEYDIKVETDFSRYVVLYVSGNQEKQDYLINKIYSMLITSNFESNFTDQFIKLSAYVFGEYSTLIKGEIKIKVIIQKLMLFYQNAKSSDMCKSIIVTCFFKLCVKHNDCKEELMEFIKDQRKSLIVDVSQRCCEYTQLLSNFPNSFLSKISKTSWQNGRLPSINDISILNFKTNDKKSATKKTQILNKINNNSYKKNFNTTSVINSNLFNEIDSITTKTNSIPKININYNGNNKENSNESPRTNYGTLDSDLFSFDEESFSNDECSQNLNLSSHFLNSDEGQLFSNKVCQVSVSFIIFPPNAKVSIFITNIIDSNQNESSNQNSEKTIQIYSKSTTTQKIMNLKPDKSEIKSTFLKTGSTSIEEDEEEEEYEDETSNSSTTTNFISSEEEILVVNNLAISTVDDLKFRVTNFPDEGFCKIESGSQKEIIIEFVAVGIFDQLPLMTFQANNETVKVNIPIIFPRWIKEKEMDKNTFLSRWNAINDTSNSAYVSLVIPDGDVMPAVKSLAKKTFGLEPLNIDLPENIIVMCGVFKCLNNSIGFLLRFVFNERENDLSLIIKTTSPLAIDILKKRAYNAFIL